MIFKNEEAGGELNGFLDSGSRLVGDLHFDDTFRVDGRFEGKILSSGHLVVGESGEVEGDVRVARVHVSGTIRGSVTGADRVEIAAGGRIIGDLATRSLVIEDGAVLEGGCSMDGSSEKASSEKLESSSAPRENAEPSPPEPGTLLSR